MQLYEKGYSTLDIIEWLRNILPENDVNISMVHKTEIIFFFHKIKSEYRCEKILMFYLLDKIFVNHDFII